MATLPLPPTTEVQITRVVKALYDAAPGNLYLNAFKEYAAENGGVVGVADGLLYEHRNMSNADLAQLIVDNLGLAKVDAANNVTDATESAAENAKAFLLWQFNVAAQTGASRGQVLVDALNNLATLGSDPIFGKAADFFNASIAQAYSYSIDPAHSTYDLAVLQQADEVTIGEGGEVVPPSVPGMTFTLTVGPDNLSPNAAVAANRTTDGDDLIRGVTANSLETQDSIDAGDGTDTIRANFTVAAATTGLETTTVQPMLASVEKIFLNASLTAGATGGDTTAFVFNAVDTAGEQEVWSEGSTITAGTGAATISINNVTLGATVGVKDSAAAVTFDYASATGTADAATLALADSTANITLAEIENLTVASNAGTVAATTANSGTLTLAQAEKVTLTGEQSATLTVIAAGLKELDASGMEASVNITHTTGGNVTIKGSAFADTFSITDSDDIVTIDLAAGNDTLNILATDYHVITTGAGRDTVNMNYTVGTVKPIDTSTAGKLAETVISVTDFTSGEDVLRLDTASGAEIVIDPTTLQNINDNSADLLVAAQSAHAAATTAKGGALVAGDVFSFQYTSGSVTNTYVIVEDGTAAGTFDNADSIIQLTGVASVTAADIVVV